jgi:hypothetical protein
MTDIFIVTSVINTGNRSWSYYPKRSLFNPKERFEQTIKTLESIRIYSSKSKILLVEGGELEEDKYNQLKILCDYTYYLGDDPETKQNCILSNCKGLGDSWLIGKGLEFIKNNNLMARNIYKVSGRYRLNENFKSDNISNDLPTFVNVHPKTYCTFCFSVPYRLLDDYYNIIKKVIDIMKVRTNISIEVLLPSYFDNKHVIKVMGAEGLIAIDTSYKIYKV